MRRARLALLAYTMAVVLAGANLATPLYPYYQRVDHLSTADLTEIFVAYVATVAVSLALAGQLSDRYGRRAVLLPAVCCALIGMAAFAASPSVGALLVGRIATGIASGAVTSVAAAALVDLAPAAAMGRAALIASAATVLGLAAGPLVSGLLVQYAPWRAHLVYLLELAALLPAVVAAAGVPRRPPPQARGPQLRWPTVPPAARAAFIRASVAFAAGWVGTAMFFALGPTFTGVILHTHNRAVQGGVVFAVFLASAAAQLFSRGWDPPRATVIGLIAFLAGLAALPVALATRQGLLFAVAAVAVGAGQGLSHRATQATVTAAAPVAARGEVVAAFYLTGYATVAVVLVALGWIIDASSDVIGLTAFAVVVGALGVAGLLAAWRGSEAPVR